MILAKCRFEVLRLTEEDPKVMPLDVELINDSIDAASGMELGTSTRRDIDRAIYRIVGHLRLVMAEELGADEDSGVMELFKQGYRLLELSTRPTPSTPVFGAFNYLRDATNLTRRLMAVYTERHGAGVT
ncbi:hypothetical protein AB0A60_25460 [Streptomyces sp. NPDC046275]|uniref:hypothetical protein n=1 Tax=Streptomyces sp. NPDC046275 TaxID=3157201 RepID=UPI0033FC0175